jgi:carboxyl-terminal processing protease
VAGLWLVCVVGCGRSPQQALVLDVFDLVDRYYVEKVDRRELAATALAGLVEQLKKDVEFEVQSARVKEYLVARDRGEDPTPPDWINDEASPAPIPTPYDAVAVQVTPGHVQIRVGGQAFDRDLPYDKKKLARVLLDGVAFYRTALQLPQSADELLQKALDAMLFKLDPHSGFLNLTDYKQLQEDTQGSFGGVGIEIGLLRGFLTIISPIAGSPAERAGLKSKDRITAIDHLETIGKTSDWAVERIRGKIGTAVILTIKRAGRVDLFDVTLVREKIEAVATKSRMLPGQIGYVRVIQFNTRTADDLERSLRELAAGGCRAVVLDLRNDPGGLLDQAVAVADKFLPAGMIVNTIGRGYIQERERFVSGRGAWTKTPMVVLVNGGSASASEIVAGALRDHRRALLIGFQTFGKGSVQSIFELRNQTGLRLTTAMYYTPSGASIQAFGITPHVRFNLPENETDRSLGEAQIPGHFQNSRRVPAPAPDIELNAERAYEFAQARRWVKKDDDETESEFNDENDLLLAFAQRVLAADDLSVDNLLARAKGLATQIEPAP